jgi:hypothetical protein
MKNKSMSIALVIILAIFSFSCDKDDAVSETASKKTTTADPNGTITTTLDPSSIIVYSDLALDAPYSIPNYSSIYTHIMLRMSMSTTNLNAGFGTYGSRDGGNSYFAGVGFQSGEMANLGTVAGLGDVTTKPSSGYASLGTIEIGHGYVIRSKKYFVNTPDAPYVYYRFYVVEWIGNTGGGINGAKIKIQGPF